MERGIEIAAGARACRIADTVEQIAGANSARDCLCRAPSSIDRPARRAQCEVSDDGRAVEPGAPIVGLQEGAFEPRPRFDSFAPAHRQIVFGGAHRCVDVGGGAIGLFVE